MASSEVIYRSGKKRRAEKYRVAANNIAEKFDRAAAGDPTVINDPLVARQIVQWQQYRALLASGHNRLPDAMVASTIDKIMNENDPTRAIQLYGEFQRTIDQNALAYGGVQVLTDLAVRYSNAELVMDEVYKPLYKAMPSGSYNIYADETEEPFQDLSMGPRGDVKTVHSAAPDIGVYNCKPLGADTRMEMAEFLAAHMPPVRHWMNQTNKVDSELAFNTEVDACEFQANAANYHASNYITKVSGSRWGDAGIDPYADIDHLDLQIRSSPTPTLRLHVMPRPVWDELKVNPLLISRISNNDMKILDANMYFQIFPKCDGLVISDVVRKFDTDRRYVMRNLFQIVQVPDVDSSTAEIAVHGMRFAWQPVGSESTRGMYVVQYMENGGGERGIMRYKKTFRSKTQLLAKKAAAAYYTPIDPAKMTPPA